MFSTPTTGTSVQVEQGGGTVGLTCDWSDIGILSGTAITSAPAVESVGEGTGAVIHDPVLPASGTGTKRGGTFTQPTPTLSSEAAEAEIMVVAGGTGIIPGGVPSIEV